MKWMVLDFGKGQTSLIEDTFLLRPLLYSSFQRMQFDCV